MMNSEKITMIKKYSVVILLLALFSRVESTIAQNFRVPGRTDTRSNFSSGNIDNSAGMRRVESIKTDYLSNNLRLTTEESDRFWPIYRQYQKELNTVLHEKRQNMLNSQKNPQDIVNDNFDYDSKILNIKKHYNQEFSRILSPDKLKQLWVSERQFNEEMIKRLRHGHDNDGN
jgi:hypothetical protein